MSTGLNPTAASLLGLLLDGPLTAGDLVGTARNRLGAFWNLTRSQVYRELEGLQRAGLAEPVTLAEDAPTQTRRYQVTEAGAQAFEAWTHEPLEQPTTRMALLLLLSLGRHVDPGHLRAVLEDQYVRHRQTLDGYEAVVAEHGRALDPFARATLDFGIAYERAVLGWLEELPPAVRGRGPLGARTTGTGLTGARRPRRGAPPAR